MQRVCVCVFATESVMQRASAHNFEREPSCQEPGFVFVKVLEKSAKGEIYTIGKEDGEQRRTRIASESASLSPVRSSTSFFSRTTNIRS